VGDRRVVIFCSPWVSYINTVRCTNSQDKRNPGSKCFLESAPDLIQGESWGNAPNARVDDISERIVIPAKAGIQ